MKLERYKDKKETRKKVILIGLTVLTLVSITMMLYKTFAKFTTSTSFPIMSGKVKYKPKGKDLTEVVEPTTSGDGLYAVEHSGVTGGWEKAELRYAGKNPNNYVYFNCNDGTEEQNAASCEKWRIIGKVNVKTSKGNVEQRLKIIKNESIGDYSWNKIEENDWTKATLMGLLNDTYYDSLSDNTYCYIPGNGMGQSLPSTCDFKNGKIKGLTEKARDMIEKEISWNIGGWSTEKVKTEEMYGYERGISAYGSNPVEWKAENTINPSTGRADSSLFRGVGLMYPSDYGYAVSGSTTSSCFTYKNLDDYDDTSCYYYDWLYVESTRKCITQSTSWPGSFSVDGRGAVYTNVTATDGRGIYPVVFLDEKVKIGEGNGTQSDPFTLVV